jgi:hypothetical protein
MRSDARASGPNRPQAPSTRRRRLGRPHRLRALRNDASFESLARAVLDPRLLGLRGEPACSEDLRQRNPGARRGRLPLDRRPHEVRPAESGARPLSARAPHDPRQLVLRHRQLGIRLPGQAHHLRRVLPTGPGGVLGGGRARSRSWRHDRGRAARRHRARYGDGCALQLGELELRRAKRPHRDAGRRVGRARNPAFRLRDVARRRDSPRDRRDCDPHHVLADLGAHVRDLGVADRPVPRRAGRPGGGDRLLAPHDLPVPGGAGPRGGCRDGSRRDDATRRSIRRGLRLDRRHRAPVHGHHPDPGHPVDRNRRDAHPGRVGGGGDHAAPRASRDTWPRNQPGCASCPAGSSR